MTDTTPAPPRCAVLIGPYLSGKTTLLEALLFSAGAIHRKGSITEGNTVGDSSPEARAREMSVEPNFAHGEYLGESWSFIDCPGSVELSQDSRNALMAADVAVLVTEPEPERALTLAPIFHFLDDHQIPHMLFVNKIEKANVHVQDLLQSLQAVSQKPLVLRQVPIRDGDDITGFVDLASERAWRYNKDQPSEQIEIPDAIKDREGEARQQMLEFLADYDDELLEQLLEDQVPEPAEIYAQLAKDLQAELIVPVLLGSAENGYGIRRLWKALRHEVSGPAVAAERQKIPESEDFTASVIKTLHAAHTGKLIDCPGVARQPQGRHAPRRRTPLGPLCHDGRRGAEDRLGQRGRSGGLRPPGRGFDGRTADRGGRRQRSGHPLAGGEIAGLRLGGRAGQPAGRGEVELGGPAPDRRGPLVVGGAQREHPSDAALGAGRDPSQARRRAHEEQVQRRRRGRTAVDRLQGDHSQGNPAACALQAANRRSRAVRRRAC